MLRHVSYNMIFIMFIASTRT